MSVVEHVRSGNVPALARELAPLTAAERRELLPGLKQLRKELRDSWSSRAGAWSCLMVAGAVCHSAPSGAAAWLGGREFEDISAWRHARLRELLDDRPAEWQAAVAERLAERRPNRWGTDERLHLVEYLVHRSGCPVPTSDGFVLHWARDRGRPGPRPEVPRPLPSAPTCTSGCWPTPGHPSWRPGCSRWPRPPSNWPAPGRPATTAGSGPPCSPSWPRPACWTGPT